MSHTRRSGLTWVEFLVVFGILALAIGLVLPAPRRVREAAARSACANNLKQIILAMHNYQDVQGGIPETRSATGQSDVANAGYFPTGCIGPGATPEDRLSWMVAILPYIEQQKLFDQMDLNKGYAGNPTAARTWIKAYTCPTWNSAGRSEAASTYVAMAGIGMDAATRPAEAPGNGFMGYDRRTSFDTIKDGSSHTIALMETQFEVGPWARGGRSNVRGFDPTDLPVIGEGRPFTGHTNGINVAMADGSIRFLNAKIDPKKLAAAITIAGGEPFELD